MLQSHHQNAGPLLSDNEAVIVKGPVNPGRITVEGVSAQNDMLVGRHLNPWKLFHMVLIFCFISVGIQIPVVIMH